jgi:hypothetical protein
MSEQDDLEQVRQALQDNLPDSQQCGVLTGYVVIAQWSDGDNEYMTTTAGDINDRGANIWHVKGWLMYALEDM